MKPEVEQQLLTTLKERFEKNIARHRRVDWRLVQAKLEASPKKLQTSMRWKALAVDLPGDDETAGLVEYADRVVDAIGTRRVILVAQSLGGSQQRRCAREFLLGL